MQNPNSGHTVKIISRTAAKKRVKRAGWFLVGTSFGIGCSLLMMTPASVPAPEVIAQNQPAPAPVVVAEAPAPVMAEQAAAAPAPDVDAVEPQMAAADTAAPEEPKPSLYPLALNLKTEDGDTLIHILTDSGVSYNEAQNAVDSLSKSYDPRALKTGQNIAVVLDENPNTPGTPIIKSLHVPLNALSTLELTRSDDSGDADFVTKKVNAALEKKLARAGGRIDSSLYETGVESGIPTGVIADIIQAYSYDVDFQRDIQPGDTTDILYERIQTKDGVAAGHGNVLYAELNLSGRDMKIYRFVDAMGFADYYNEKGESIRKALLRTPINGAKITSAFGMRNHPILGYSKMHRGVDFGAPEGTPIYAAGDGIVEFAGPKGGYGNYLRIHHNNKYDSAYGHISRFATGISPGHKVKQGQIVAYVGATGMATGPHLHYEILVNNEQVNPAGVKFKTGNVLMGKELKTFHKNMEQIQAQLANTPRKTDLAMAY